MRRRDFIAALGSTTVLPLVARAQVLPVIGVLHSTSEQYYGLFTKSVGLGLSESGWIEKQNVTIDYRWAEGRPERLRPLADEFVRQQVAAIFAVGGSAPAQGAKAATSTIPIVFISAADPIKAGLVTSLNRPGANVTGISLIGSALESKRLELLHQLVPGSGPIGVLMNPDYPDIDRQRRELQDAAGTLKRSIQIVNARNAAEIDAAFEALVQKGVVAVLPAQDIFFNTRRQQLVALAAQHRLPALYNQREYSEIGGLASYGTHYADGYRQAGSYLGKILKGAKPVDLPVLQPTKFELVINLKTAKALGLDVPASLLATADEVIE